mmetsp:Transcript_38894/g.88364  ORF Transcript_38894/g.88364 Transcript_38894/m.88364 type:complete len:83 (-) Transcript_38894:112-360(-)
MATVTCICSTTTTIELCFKSFGTATMHREGVHMQEGWIVVTQASARLPAYAKDASLTVGIPMHSGATNLVTHDVAERLLKRQ